MTDPNTHVTSYGSTVLLTDASGTTLEAVRYSPYGTPTITSGSAATNLLYAGQYTDPQSGLIYLRARWYDPATAQFLSVDPVIAQTQMPYSYAGGNPTDATDPMGLAPICSGAATPASTIRLDAASTNPYRLLAEHFFPRLARVANAASADNQDFVWDVGLYVFYEEEYNLAVNLPLTVANTAMGTVYGNDAGKLLQSFAPELAFRALALAADLESEFKLQGFINALTTQAADYGV